MSLKYLLFVLLIFCLLSDGDGRKTKGNKTKKKKTSLIKTAKKIQEQLDPAGIINPSRKTSRTMDLAKLTEE
ncbi:hypothetical protein PDJAM_G00163870, partial [Pangasius djambal]|nr:hypothetical protein [Pangasius djambal]